LGSRWRGFFGDESADDEITMRRRLGDWTLPRAASSRG
jgi:hypothetical protein